MSAATTYTRYELLRTVRNRQSFVFALAVPAVLFIGPPKAPWWLVLGFGLSFGFALYGFLNLSIAWGMSAGLSSLVLQVQAFFTMALAFVLLGERPSRNQIVGALIAELGSNSTMRSTGMFTLRAASTASG